MTVTKRSYLFRLDCKYPLGVKAIFFITTSTKNNSVQIIPTVARISVWASSLFHYEDTNKDCVGINV